MFCACLLFLSSCYRMPELHLPSRGNSQMEFPLVDLDLDVYWDYELEYGVSYDWRAEWHYGWDSTDYAIFGDIGLQPVSVMM